MSLRSKLVSRFFPERRAWQSFVVATEHVCAPGIIEEALSAVRNKNLNIEEKREIKTIESLRTELERNKNYIKFVDYGAGLPDSNRTKQEMEMGVETKLKIGDMCKRSSNNPMWLQLIFQLVRKHKPHRSIEMGTCLGISAAYIASALRINGLGSLITLEGDEALARIARDNLRQLEFSNVNVKTGKFSDTLGPALKEMKPVDFIFVDGHHDENATKTYFESIVPFLSDNAIMVFDDIKWSVGMERAWGYIGQYSDAYDLGPKGVCLNVNQNRPEFLTYRE